MTEKKKDKPVWFGMKLTPEEKQKIKRLAQRQGISSKQAILRLVDASLLEKDTAPRGSFLEGIEDLVGSVEGPADLSSNPRYLDGFGK